MDKYTIDLDKLLNDFEYSELTEQNNILSSNCQNSQPYQKNHNTQKHSINNVFHSLNEYLNTDISSRTEVDAPSTSLNNCQDDVGILVKKVPKDDVPTIEQIFNNLTKEEPSETCENGLNNNVVTVEEETVEPVIEETNDLIEVEEPETPKIVSINDDSIEVEVVEQAPVVERIETVVEAVVIAEQPQPQPPQQTVVKFDDSIELSDTEVENELEQLEQEYQTKLIEKQSEEEQQLVEPTEETVETVEAVETEVEDKTIEEEDKKNVLRPNCLELSQDNEAINLIGEPGSTPYNNVYVSVPDPDPEKALSPTLSESSSTYEQSNSDSPNTSDSCNDTSLEETNNMHNGNNNEEAAAAPTLDEAAPTWLGKTAPFWTPDGDALACLHCNRKFTVINRRHHCRACGLVLCSKCSSMKCKLEYMDNQEARVCLKCYEVLQSQGCQNKAATSSSESDVSPENQATTTTTTSAVNPNNPMEYCSTVPPLQQASGTSAQPPPSVMVPVPVGVLKRKGSNKARSNKSVMFMDGIRPGCDLTELDTDFNYKQQTTTNINNINMNINKNNRKQQQSRHHNQNHNHRNVPKLDPKTASYIPAENNELPPIVTIQKSDVFYSETANNSAIIEQLKKDVVVFAIQRNLHVQVKIINMECCINKEVWCFATDGMISVGQDEIVILLELIDNERSLPKDIFTHLNYIYSEAVKGTSIIELGISIHNSSSFLESKNHAGFLYIKPTFQCLQNVLVPKEPYLIGILMHRWETPWAKIFPLRLLLRLGAEYRYYPSPIISTRHRESVYVEIGHTIINLLADFRNFSYTIPSVRGLTIHMEDKNTTVSLPQNRYDQVMKALNNSSEHILAFSANFSVRADSHLVCIQDTHGNNENAYTTHAINIHNKPRKVTGASFIILNGALKSSSGLTAKSSIIEDGLMIHILPEQMQKLRTALKQMKDFKISCGCVNAQSDETISILWTENDVHFNVGVVSPIDNMPLNGVPSIRVHNGRDFICNSGNKMIRWTEVFIIQSGEELMKSQDPIDISKISESISKGTSQALVKYLDLLATNSCTKIGIRTNLNIENVSYLAGSNGAKLRPIYMKSLDNELIPVLHKITSNFAEQVTVVLELKFHILNV